MAPLLLLGCQSDLDPVPVAGTVSMDGKPLADGTISFVSADPRRGQNRNAPIVNGRFELPAREGLVAETEFKVEIKSFRKTGRKYPNADPSLSHDEVEQVIPKRYNTETELRVTVSRNPAENEWSFDLHRQKTP